MKNQTRLMFLAAFAASSSLAANPGAGALAAAAGSNSGSLATAARSGAGAAQQDQMVRMAKQNEPKPETKDLETLAGKLPFEFKPTKDFPILGITTGDLEKFSNLGEELVQFAKSRESRIDNERTDLIGKIRAAAGVEAKEASERHRKALQERIEAGNALNDLKVARERAENAVKAAEDKAAEARAGVERVEARIAEVAKDKQALDRAVKAAEDKAAEAGQARDRAKKAHDASVQDVANAQSAHETAQAERKKAEDGLAAAQEGLRFAKVQRTLRLAEEDVARTDKRAEEARAALAEAQAAEKKGWFTRLFAPSVAGAQKDVEKAASALAEAKKAETEAKAAVKATQKTLVATTVREAEKEVDAAERTVRAAQREIKRRKDAETEAQEALDRAKAKEAKLKAALDETIGAAEQAKDVADQLRNAKDATARAGLVNKKPLDDAKNKYTAANKKLAERKKALKDMGDNSGRLAILEERAKVAENKWREAQPAFQASQRRLDPAVVRAEANRQVVEMEERAEKANREKTDVAWNHFLDDKIKAAVSKAGVAEAAAPKGAAASQKAAQDARNAYETARGRAEDLRKRLADLERGDAYRGARTADEAAREALEAAEKALKKAQAGKDGAALAAAREGLSAARKDAAKAAKAWKQAQDAHGDAAKKSREAADALPGLKAKAEAAEKALAQAEKDVRTARRSRERTEGRVREAVAELRKMFEDQVAAASTPGGNEGDWEGVGRTAAQRARSRYEGLRGDRDRALRAWRAARENLARRLDAEGTAMKWENRSSIRPLVNAYDAARAELAKRREAFDKAEDEYNTYFSDAEFRTDLSIGDAAVAARYEGTNGVMSRSLYRPDGDGRWAVRGDRRWLARTSVNGENLLDVLRDEFAWQAEDLVARKEAKRDEYDPLRVNLTKEQSESCAAMAATYAKRRAIYGGYYFCGIDVDGETGAIRVDKGRFGPATVNFVDADGAALLETNGNPVVDGRIYTAEDILSRFASRNAPTNNLEGETFNFIAFQRAFNRLNANPDIKQADVVFDVSSDYAYNYDRDQGWGIEDVDETNTMTRAVKATINVQENRRPAPLHGVLSIDNGNSMGDPDQMGVEDADTWMARLLLQRRLGLFSDEDSLSVAGNMSLGASLWGVSGGYYVPRDEDARLWRRGEWADAVSWTLHGGYTDVNQEDVVDGLDVLGTGYYGGLQASTRAYDSGRGAWDLSLGLTFRHIENSLDIEGTEYRLGPGEDGDPYELLPLSVALLYADKDLDSWRGRNFATFELVYNLGVSSASDLAAFRPAIDNDRYTILRAQLARLQLLWESRQTPILPRMLFLRADAQWALDPVIGAEQFGLGGHSTVRGYAERQFMGDQGAAASIEFRTPILLNPGWIRPRRNNPYESGEQIQLVYFVDLGWYNLQDASPDGDEDNLLVGLGLGLRYSADDIRVLGRGINPVFRLDWAYPVWQQTDLEDSEKSSAGVFHASLQFPF